MRYLSLQEVISLHSLLIAQSGGSSGVRDRGALESAVAQPEVSFSGEDLYPDLASKAAALAHSLIQFIRSSMETSESVMPRWKFFSY